MVSFSKSEMVSHLVGLMSHDFFSISAVSITKGKERAGGGGQGG